MVVAHQEPGCELPCFERCHDTRAMRGFGTSLGLASEFLPQSRRIAATNPLLMSASVCWQESDSDKPSTWMARAAFAGDDRSPQSSCLRVARDTLGIRKH